MKEAVTTDAAPKAIGPYSQAVKAGGFVFCSGQIALDPTTGTVIEGGIVEQTEQVMKNVAGLLKASGCSFADVVRATVFLKSMSDFAAVNEVYGKYVAKGGAVPPSRSTVAVAGLPRDVLVEIDVIAITKN
jgi:2-iminobutanoate/2-iminopropanoate deaminase